MLSFGLLWGLCEVVIPLALHTSCPGTSIGSILAGGSFFFLAAGYHASRRIWAPIIVFITTTLVKISGYQISHGSFFTSSLLNPIGAYFSQSLVFFGIVIIVAQAENFSYFKAITAGIIGGTLSGFLYPYLVAGLGQTACMHAGTGFPVSVYYAPLTALIAAPVCLAGSLVGRYFYTQNISGHQIPAFYHILFNLFTFGLILAFH